MATNNLPVLHLDHLHLIPVCRCRGLTNSCSCLSCSFQVEPTLASTEQPRPFSAFCRSLPPGVAPSPESSPNQSAGGEEEDQLECFYINCQLRYNSAPAIRIESKRDLAENPLFHNGCCKILFPICPLANRFLRIVSSS